VQLSTYTNMLAGPQLIPATHLHTRLPGIDSLQAHSSIKDQTSATVESLWQRQRLQRAEILGQARVLIEQEGYSSFNIRRLADKCAVSRQTVYNLIGDRDQLLKAALCEYLDTMLSTASTFTDYPYFFLGICDVFWAHALKNPDYAREVTLAHYCADTPAATNLHRIMDESFCKGLRHIKQQGQLRDSTDIELLSGHLQSLITSIALKWVEKKCDLATLRRSLVTGAGFLLLGAMTTAARQDLEKWVDAAQVSG